MLQGWRAFVSSSYASASEEQDRDDDEKMAKAKRAWTMPTPQERTVTTRDGVKLTYYVIPGMSERVIVLAPGLYVFPLLFVVDIVVCAGDVRPHSGCGAHPCFIASQTRSTTSTGYASTAVFRNTSPAGLQGAF